MKFKTESKRIGQHTYHVMQLDAVRGSKALLRLSKVIGPLFDGGGGADDVFTKVANSISEADFEWFREMFASQTTVTGGQYHEDAEPSLDNIFGEHFASNYFEMIEWLVFCFEVNFRSFFAQAIAKMAKVKAKVESVTPSTSPKTSTGASGE